MNDLLHVKGQIDTIVCILVHVPLGLFQFFLGSILRWDKYIDQLIHQFPVLLFMFHSKHIQLILHTTCKLSRINA